MGTSAKNAAGPTVRIWPAVDAFVRVQLPCCALATRVRYRDGDRLALTAPQHLCAPANVGTAVILRWQTREGPAVVAGQLTALRGRSGPAKGNDRVWEVTAHGSPELQTHQRRHERVAQMLALCVSVGGRQVPVRVTDLSEGGMACVAGAAAPIQLGDVLTASLQLGRTPLPVRARVVRRRTNDRGALDLGLAFEGMGAEGLEQLRQHLQASAKVA